MFDDAQTGGDAARRLLLMGCKAMLLALYALAMSLITTPGLASEEGVPSLTEAVNSWPWFALAAIALLLGVIARAARRRLPFGRL